MIIRRVRLVLVCVTLVVLETTVFRHLRVFDAVPNIALVATAAIAFEEGPQTGAIFGFASGLLLDMFLIPPAGISALAFAITGYLVGVFQGGMLRDTRGVGPVLGAAAGLLGNVIFLVVAGIAGRDGMFTFTEVRIVIVAALYDGVIAFLIFPLMHWANFDPDRTRGWR